MSQDSKPREVLQFETSWGHVKCHDGESVWFPRFFGDGLASKINGRKTFITITYDGPINVIEASALDEARKEIKHRSEKMLEYGIKIQKLRAELDTANALLEKAFKLIRKFDPEDCFIFEDGSEDLAQEVVDFIQEIEQYKESK